MARSPSQDLLTTALAAYDLQGSRYRLISDRENSIYKVDGDRSYMLRLGASDADRQHLRSEVSWLIAIRNDTNLLVPTPVPNASGDLITQVGNRCCVLFEWLEGEPVSQIMSPAIASQIGEMMATLHRHAEQYRPENSTSSRYDYNYYFGRESWWQTKAEQKLSESYQNLVPAIEKAQRLLKRLGELPKHFGMCHTDIHFSNVISSDDTFAVIDFENCGLTYYLTDLAVTEAEFRDYPNADRLIYYFRETYEAVRGYLPDSEEIRTASVLAGLLYLEWVFESENDGVREDKSEWIPSVISDIQQAMAAR